MSVPQTNSWLQDAFPSTQPDVPTSVALASPLHQTRYLVNGELRTWTGDVHEVLSPIGLRVGDKVRVKLLATSVERGFIDFEAG